MAIKRKLRKLFRDPKLFFSDMLIKHRKKLDKLKPIKKYDGQNQFTVVSAVYGVEKYLDDYFKSLVNQRLDFKQHIQLILVDDGSQDGSAAIIKKWRKKYPKNILYLYKKNGGQASARNLGIKYVKTKWVTFIDPDDFIDKNYFFEVDNFIQKNNNIGLIGCNFIFYFEKDNLYKDTHPLRYKFTANESIVDGTNLKDNIQMAVNSAIFLTEIIQNNKIEYNILVKPNFEDAQFVAIYLSYIRDLHVAFLKKPKYFYRKRADETSTIDTGWQDKRIFLDKIKYGHHTIFEFYLKHFGYVPRYIQRMILYDISWILKRIIRHPKVALSGLSDNEKRDFFRLLSKSLSYIEGRTIETFNLAGFWWLDKVILLGAFKKQVLPVQFSYVEKINARNDLIFSVIHYGVSNVRFVSNGRILEPIRVKNIEYAIEGVELATRSYYWIPVGEIDDDIGIYVDGILSNITIKGKRYNRLISRKELLKDLLYLGDKKVWVLMDRDVQADDNAEHLYRFIKKNHPEQNIYFILMQSSHDWDRLEKEGFNLIGYGTKEHKDILSTSNRLISSHADEYVINPFKDMRVKNSFVFLQHGIIQNDHSAWLNTKTNLDLFITSTKAEYNSIASNNSNYVFTDREVILTGLPRHDELWRKSLVTPSQKIILIMPTWRSFVVGIANEGSQREANDKFMLSKYYQEWNSILNSEMMKKINQKYGYTVVFAPHKNIEPYIDLFDYPSYVKKWVSNGGESIQDLFVKSAFLVTDYSSVAFEMAYLNKPVFYYQFDEQDFFYNHTLTAGYYCYDKHGLGPKVVTEEELFNEILYVCNNDGISKEKYLNRIRNTFIYQDSNNSQRVYNSIKELDVLSSEQRISIEKKSMMILDNDLDVKFYCYTHKDLSEKLHSLLSKRLVSIDDYYQCLKFACDIGRLDIVHALYFLDKDKEIYSEYLKNNNEIYRIFSFIKNKEIDSLYNEFVLNTPNKINIDRNKDLLLKKIKGSNPSLSTAFDNMILSYRLFLFFKTYQINSLSSQEAILIWNFFKNAKNCSLIRKSTSLLGLIEYCMCSDMPDFFALKSKYYNQVNTIFSTIIYCEYINKDTRKLLIHRYMGTVKKYNNFNISSVIKVALCISGKYRNHQNSIESIYRNIVEPLNADVFIHTWDTVDVWSGIGSAPFITRSLGADVTQTLPYGIQQIPELSKYFPHTCKVFYQPISRNIDQTEFSVLRPLHVDFENEGEFINKLGEGHTFERSRGSLNQIKMFYGIKKVFDQALKNKEYDYLIRCRPDWLIDKQITAEDVDKLENNTFYSYIDPGYAFSDALFIISASMGYNFSQFVNLMLGKKCLSPFDNYPEYDAHNLVMSWILKNNYKYDSERLIGKILPNQIVHISGLYEALTLDYENLSAENKSKFQPFINIILSKYGR